MTAPGLIDLLLGLPLVVLVALVCSLVLAASALAVLLVAGNGRDETDDAQRIDSVRARLQAERDARDAEPGDTVPGWLTREP